MESEYVRKNVGDALAKGLAQVALQRPNDPIEFLALWLLQHKNNLAERENVRLCWWLGTCLKQLCHVALQFSASYQQPKVSLSSSASTEPAEQQETQEVKQQEAKEDSAVTEELSKPPSKEQADSLSEASAPTKEVTGPINPLRLSRIKEEAEPEQDESWYNLLHINQPFTKLIN